MKWIKIKTPIDGQVIENFEKLDKKLFKELTPPGMKIKINRFDGKAVGDEIHLQIKSLMMPAQEWICLVSESKIDSEESFFVDIGKRLPWPIKHWSHKHLVSTENQQTFITDDIEYTCNNFALELIYYPIFYLMFYLRKSVYRRYFRGNNV